MPSLPLIADTTSSVNYLFAAAQEQGLALSNEEARWLVYGAIAVIALGFLQAIHWVLGIVKFFRADPPFHQVFATKLELKQSVDRVDRDLNKLDKRVSEIQDDTDKHLAGIYQELRSLNRSLGRVEGGGD